MQTDKYKYLQKYKATKLLFWAIILVTTACNVKPQATPTPTPTPTSTSTPPPTATYTPEATPTLDQPALEEAYIEFVVPRMTAYSEASEELSQWMGRLSKDVNTFIDPDFKPAVRKSLEAMNKAIGEIDAYENVPVRYQEAHKWFHQTYLETKALTENLTMGLSLEGEPMETDKLMLAPQNMANIIEFNKTAYEEMEKLKE